MASLTDRPVCREGTRGRFSSKRKPLMPHVRASIGCPSTGPRDQHRPIPAHGEAKETPSARLPRNPPPPSSPTPTGQRCAFHAAQAARCILRDQSRSSLNSCVKANPGPDCRQAASCSSGSSDREARQFDSLTCRLLLLEQLAFEQQAVFVRGMALAHRPDRLNRLVELARAIEVKGIGVAVLRVLRA